MQFVVSSTFAISKIDYIIIRKKIHLEQNERKKKQNERRQRNEKEVNLEGEGYKEKNNKGKK